MPYSTTTPWWAIAEKKRRAADRADLRAAELRRQAAALELRHTQVAVADVGREHHDDTNHK